MLYIAKNLKHLRKENDMTQEEVAEALGISPQSVSKWEREESFPDITLLPALANLYQTSIDAIIGMDQINNGQSKNRVFIKAHEYMRDKKYDQACDILTEALKLFPNDQGLMSELALASALSGSSEKLHAAIQLCHRVLSGLQCRKVYHTTQAALCFIYKKMQEDELAVAVANQLPHIRESRESVLAEISKNLTEDEINEQLRRIALGESTA
ncbi:MAG TPA: helix-turn-helix domain-containing protein [Firmicutes bacterium]|nr:helix-turn-helix domain-containing protein [Bacillota bacterium]